MWFPQFDFPVWSNADIAVGPDTPDRTSPTVDPDEFLTYCHDNLPGATLSLGRDFFVQFSGKSKLVIVRYFEIDQFFEPVRSFFPLS